MKHMNTDKYRALELSAALKNTHLNALRAQIDTNNKGDILNLLNQKKIDINTAMYDSDTSVDIYRNFLDWLFATFQEDEMYFRKTCLARFGDIKGKKILITSCGLGEDLTVAIEHVGQNGVVHAQDLSERFAAYAAERNKLDNVFITVSDALDLPYANNYFDAVYHFGGINLFGDIRLAISEMERVCKVGGQVMFGDESVAMHLRDNDYGKMFIHNNDLWGEKLPLSQLPLNASDINITYVLGNCFYLIQFTKMIGLPSVNSDVPHIGYRGGSVRKRYQGGIEGIDVSLKNALYERAKKENRSVSAILESLVNNYLN